MIAWPGKEPNVQGLMDRFPSLDGKVQMLWHSSYWDGPLSGYVSVDGEPGHWAHCIADHWNERPNDSDDSCTGADGDGGCEDYPGHNRCCMKVWGRVYLVYRLDSEQEGVLLSNHALFREHVGTHTDYDENGKRGGKDYNDPADTDPIKLGQGVKPRDSWKAFYGTTKPEASPLREEQVVGHTCALFSNPKEA